MKRSTLYLWVEKGTIPHYRVGRLIRFKSEEIDAWLEEFKKEVTSQEAITPKYPESITTYEANKIIQETIEDIKGLKV